MATTTLFNWDQYIQDVQSGAVVTNEYVKKAVKRHLDDLVHADERGLYFDRDEADWVCRSFPILFKHFEGELAGQPFELMGWQSFIIANIFGWKWKATGMRRFRRAYIEVARRNGKSTMLAALALLMLIADGEPSAQVYAAATKRDQAKIVWGDARKMVRASRELSSVVQIYRDQLYCKDTDSVFIPLGADSKTLDGLNIHAAIVDELHAHPTPEVWQLLDTSTGSRQQPLLVAITTAGFNQNGICYEIREMVLDILNRTRDNDSWFGFVAGLDDGDVYSDETVWEKANPNIRFISTLRDDLREKSSRASHSAFAMNNFLTKCMSRWTSQAQRWLALEDWDKCRAQTPFTYEDMKGRPAFAAIDLSEKLDLTAACICFPPLNDGEKWRYLWNFYLPEDTIDRYIQAGDLRWKQWVLSGEITSTTGGTTDQTVVRDQLLEWQKDFDLRMCGFDPWNCTRLAGELIDAGIEMVEIRQNMNGMSEGAKTLEAQIVTHVLEHTAGPLMRWQVDNVAVAADNEGNCRPVRPQKNSNTKKVDGIVAACMACGLATRVSLNTATDWTVFTV